MSGYTGRMNQNFSIISLFTLDGRVPVITPTTLVLRGYMPDRAVGRFSVVPGSDNSPRSRTAIKLQFAAVTVGVDTPLPTPGSVISIRGEHYEVLSNATELLANRMVYGYEIKVLPLSLLYPNEGTVGGLPVKFSMWPREESIDSRGEYDVYTGEAPAASWALLRVTNASILFEDVVYRITSSMLNTEQPHVALTLKKRGA